MPNWCENDLSVEGPTDQVQAFYALVTQINEGDVPEEGVVVFNFSAVIPYPEEYVALDRVAREWERNNPNTSWTERPKDGFNSGGYEWCRDNWGTKWNPYHGEWGEIDTWADTSEVTVTFSTAWRPPKPIVVRLSELFPSLEFTLRYFEGGMQFNGIFVCREGEVTQDEVGSYFGTRGG